MRIHFARATPQQIHHAEFHQSRIAIDRVEYMRKARHRSRKRQCERTEHDYDGPIQPSGAGAEFAFEYCRDCHAVKWVS